MPSLDVGPLHFSFYCADGLEVVLDEGAACPDSVLLYEWAIDGGALANPLKEPLSMPNLIVPPFAAAADHLYAFRNTIRVRVLATLRRVWLFVHFCSDECVRSQDASSQSILVERVVTMSCKLRELGATISGPQTIDTSQPLSLVAKVLDPDESDQSVNYEWICSGEAGPCFFGLATPEVRGSTFTVKADTLKAGKYTIKVRANVHRLLCWELCPFPRIGLD